MTLNLDTKAVKVAETSLTISRIGLGTWAIGGWMWGGTDDQESVNTIRAAVDSGINLIDTAPAYGFGRSEEIVGRAIAEGKLDPWWLADPHRVAYTKQGLSARPRRTSGYSTRPTPASRTHVWPMAWADVINDGVTPQAAVEKALKRVEEIFAKYPIAQG
jgi:Aldo/keto reductase family